MSQTKAQRLLDLFDAFQKLQGGGPVQMTEVASWATSHGLYPVPTKGSDPRVVDRWDELFAQATGGGS
jgi:hypothetical protein